LPGYIAFTTQVNRVLTAHKRTFLLLVAAYAAIMLVLGGVTSQEVYTQISNLLTESSGQLFSGGADQIGQAGLLLISTFATGPGALTADQQIYLSFALLLAWLSTVWLHREYMLGRSPRLRDGLYNSGAPVISTLALVLILIAQLLPVGIVALIYASLQSVGLIDGGFGAMMFWLFALAVIALVLYWVTSTIIGLVVVTLPGMYPLKALKASSDLVVGRRLRVLYRLLWGACMVAIAWLVIFIPLILIDTAIKNAWTQLANLPILPVIAALVSAASLVWFASYVYILYRKVVDDDAASA
jgi:hypothetical protein